MQRTHVVDCIIIIGSGGGCCCCMDRHKVYLINLTVQTNKLKFHFDTIHTIRVLNNGAFHTQTTTATTTTTTTITARMREREMMQLETQCSMIRIVRYIMSINKYYSNILDCISRLCCVCAKKVGMCQKLKSHFISDIH